MIRTRRMLRQLPIAVLAVTVSLLAAAEPSRPIALHPENPHYFLWRDQPTVLITSGEHYGALLNLDFDYSKYFDELVSRKLNHTRTFSGAYREVPSSFGITDNPLAPTPGRFVCPWARSDQPGDFDGGHRFDLTRWDTVYFTRLRDFMEQARRRGIVVEFTLFCPMYDDELWKACPMNAANNVNDIGACPSKEVFTLQHQKLLDAQVEMTRKIVAELREYDNLYYEVCNEPYFGGVTMDWQHRIVDTIVEAERAYPHKHLISLNIANGSQKVENPHPMVSILNFHYCAPPDAVAINYGLNRVIGENETGFRGRADVLYRTEAWDFLIAGGGLYNNLDYSFTPKHPAGTFLDYRSPGGGSPTLRGQLRILREFLDGFEFVRMKPDNEVIRELSRKLSARALVQPGKAYAIYLHVPIPNKPKETEAYEQDEIETTLTMELPAGEYTAEWLNPKTGKIDHRETFEHPGGAKSLASPKFAADVALRVVRKPKSA